MRRIAESEISKFIARYGFSGAVAGFLIWFLAQGVSGDMRDLKAAAMGIRGEHVVMGQYMKAICVGVNRGNPEGLLLCQAAMALEQAQTHAEAQAGGAAN